MTPDNFKLQTKNEEGDLVHTLLHNRNIPEHEWRAFLAPDYEACHDPLLLPDIEPAIDRLHRAIEDKEKIVIYADYDADGIPSAVIMHSLLEKLRHSDFEVYIPHRHDEGYGIHMEAMAGLLENGARLVIAVDVGTTDFETATFAKEKGKDLVIIDHHTPLLDETGQEKLPDAYALVNPKRHDSKYQEKQLCAGGVTYKFVQAFLGKYGETYKVKEGWEKWLLDMVGIATISDMVPLLGENRILAHYGLVVLRRGKRPGLRTLLEYAGVRMDKITEDDIAFSVSPKINAASRMSHPMEAFELLVAKNDVEAKVATEHLISLNTERKLRVAHIMKEAKAKIKKRELGNCLVIGDPKWNAGVLGLVANKLVEDLEIPVFVWSEENSDIKGSCRGLPGQNLVTLMGALPKGTFLQFGGHSEAGGFTCAKEHIHDLEQKLCTAIDALAGTVNIEPTMIDTILPLDRVNKETYTEISTLAPFGMSNPRPLFLFEHIIISRIRTFGGGNEHLELEFKQSTGRSIKAIAFFKSIDSFARRCEVDASINLLAHIECSYFRNREEIRLRIVEVY